MQRGKENPASSMASLWAAGVEDWVGGHESRWNSVGPQETEHPEWKPKLSLLTASWSQMLKYNREEKDIGKPSRNVQVLLRG